MRTCAKNWKHIISKEKIYQLTKTKNKATTNIENVKQIIDDNGQYFEHRREYKKA